MNQKFVREERKQKKFCACVCLGLQFSKFSKLSLVSLSSSLFIFELARALKKRYKNGGRNATTT